MSVREAAAALQLVGTLFEIWGTFHMVKGYLQGVKWRQRLNVLWAAVRNQPAALGAAELSELTSEDRRETLRGLAFLGCGFALQAIGGFVALFLP